MRVTQFSLNSKNRIKAIFGFPSLSTKIKSQILHPRRLKMRRIDHNRSQKFNKTHKNNRVTCKQKASPPNFLI